MTDITTAPFAAKATPKKNVATKTKTAVSSHPSTAIMVTTAIQELKDKKGSSLQAIKKYMSANYKIDSAKFAPFIRKFLKAAVSKGLLVQTNGSGASGHFKMAAAEAKKSVPKKKVVAKKPAAKKAPGAAAKKRKSLVKKSKAEPVAKKAKNEGTAPKPKGVKPAKTKKAPATKTKAPKVKKTPVKKTAPKKQQ